MHHRDVGRPSIECMRGALPLLIADFDLLGPARGVLPEAQNADDGWAGWAGAGGQAAPSVSAAVSAAAERQASLQSAPGHPQAAPAARGNVRTQHQERATPCRYVACDL